MENVINNFKGTVGNSFINHKNEIDNAYAMKKNLIDVVKNIFDVDGLTGKNSYTEEVLINLNRKSRDAQLYYIYDIIQAGFGNKIIK